MSHFDDLGDRLLVIYDGHCGLCNRSVRWLLQRDRRDRLRFAPSVSQQVAPLLARPGIVLGGTQASPETILVIRGPGKPNERILVRSDAVVALLAELPNPWPSLGTVLAVIPRPVRDFGYRLVARWRYRIWGRLNECPVPPNERGKFL